MGVGLPFNPYRAIICLIIAIFLIVGLFSHGSHVPIFKHKTIKFVPSAYSWSNHSLQYPISQHNMTAVPKGDDVQLNRIQHEFFYNPDGGDERKSLDEKLDDIRNAFRRAWATYEKHAWGRDELKPLSLRSSDTLGGWGASMIESLGTLWLMNLKSEFNEAVEHVARIDWNQTTSDTVDIFETNVRYLGGLLSAYDLSGEAALLYKATELGDLLYAAFDNAEHFPPRTISFEDLKHGKGHPSSSVSSARLGSMTLEFTRLSQLTDDPKYYDAINRISRGFDRTQNSTLIPGLWPTVLNAVDGFKMEGDTFSLGADGDSLYEYIIKEYILLQGKEPMYKKMYTSAVDVMIDRLLFRPMLPDQDDVLMAGQMQIMDDKISDFQPHLEHISCFAGGMIAYGGKVLGRDEHVVTGDKLTRGCVHAYSVFPHHIMPEESLLHACPSKDPCEFRPKTSGTEPEGFRVRDGRFLLRPQAIESVFMLYRITGNEEYREIAWNMWRYMKRATETSHAFAAIQDVSKKELTQMDSMESFWLGETLKYFYLMFEDEEVMHLDRWVFNTAGHPLRAARP